MRKLLSSLFAKLFLHLIIQYLVRTIFQQGKGGRSLSLFSMYIQCCTPGNRISKNKTINKKSAAFSFLLHYVGLIYASAALLFTLFKSMLWAFPDVIDFFQISLRSTWFNKHHSYLFANSQMSALVHTEKP